MRVYILISTLFVLFSLGESRGQDTYKVEHYTSDNGLPQNSIKSIAKDGEGFIWLATEDGLVRFDGRKFSVHNNLNLNISNNRVFGIVSKIKKSLQPSKGFEKVSYATFLNGEVASIENGLVARDTSYVVKSMERLRRIKLEPPMRVEASGYPSLIGLGGDPIRYMIFAGNNENNLYLCDKDQITYYNAWKQEYVVKFSASTLWHFFSVGERLYYFDGAGTITNISKGKVITYALSGDISSHSLFKKSKAEFQLFWDNNSNQAFIYFEKNIYELISEKDGSLVTKLLIENFDFQGKNIVRIYFDGASQKVFLGSRIQGLFVVTKQQFRTIKVQGSESKNVFYAQVPYDSNSIVTPNGIIAGRDANTRKTIERMLPISDSLFPDEKRYILRDSQNAVWIASGENLFFLDEKAEKIRKKWRFSKQITSIHQGKSGDIWLSVYWKGLYRIGYTDTIHSPELVIKDSTLNVTYIESHTKDRLLIGTDGGLYVFDIAGKKLRLINQTKGLHIKSIHIFGSDQIWFTSLGHGLSVIDDNRITSFPLDKNKYLSSPHCIVNDQKGFIWIPTNRGLFQIAIKDLLSYARWKTPDISSGLKSYDQVERPGLFYLYHTSDEGFNTNEFNGSCYPCSARLENGMLSLPSMEGLVWFDPTKIKTDIPNTNIILNKVEVDQTDRTVTGDTIWLPMNPRNVRLHFSVAYFGDNYNLNLSYALINQHEPNKPVDWIPLDNDRLDIQYSNLSSGNYMLIVRKLNGFGINNYGVKKLYLIVPEKWFETIWGIFLLGALCFFGVVMVAYVYNRYRLKGMIKKNKVLEETVAERTGKLRETLLGLEASRKDLDEQVHLFSRLVTSISHDVQSPLRYIAFASQKIPQLIQANQLDNASSLGTAIFDLSDRMTTMLEDLLNFIKVQVYGKKMHFESIDLQPLIAEKLEIFKNVVDQNSSSFINDVPTMQKVFSNYQLLSIVIHNLIDNAAKYTYNGHVRIFVQPAEGYTTELVITNTGRGIPLQIIEMMNSPVKEKSLDDLLKTGRVKGLGLLIVKEIGELAGITIKVTQSEVTSFDLYFE